MRSVTIIRLVAVGALIAGVVGISSAQHRYTQEDIDNGARLYRASCATCHGPDGASVRGVALFTGRFQRAQTDDEVARIIQKGIPGTAMPPASYSDLEAGMIVAFLRTVAAGGNVAATAGDAARGKAIFDGKGKCATCHGADATGSRMAPSLADIGILRRPPDLERALLDPGADLHADFRFVRLVTRNGTTITGRLLNQSTFSVQMLDSTERLRAFDRADLREVDVLRTSPMPSYRGTLTDQEIADLVVYLTSLRGPDLAAIDQGLAPGRPQ